MSDENLCDLNVKYVELQSKYYDLETQYLLLKHEKETLQAQLQEKIDYIDSICEELNKKSFPKTFTRPTVSSDFQVEESKPLGDLKVPSRNLKEIVHGERINVTPKSI